MTLCRAGKANYTSRQRAMEPFGFCHTVCAVCDAVANEKILGEHTRFVLGFAIFNIKTDITHVSEAAAFLSPLRGVHEAVASFWNCSRKVRI